MARILDLVLFGLTFGPLLLAGAAAVIFGGLPRILENLAAYLMFFSLLYVAGRAVWLLSTADRGA